MTPSILDFVLRPSNGYWVCTATAKTISPTSIAMWNVAIQSFTFYILGIPMTSR